VALADRFGLSRREAAVARQLAAGRRNAEIADALGITVHTVKRHAEQVYAKLGVSHRGAVAERLRAPRAAD
jgi:DNA-binding CsgD family transcriptional regulator